MESKNIIAEKTKLKGIGDIEKCQKMKNYTYARED